MKRRRPYRGHVPWQDGLRRLAPWQKVLVMQLKKINALVDLELRVGDLMSAVTAAHVAYLARFNGEAMDDRIGENVIRLTYVPA